MIFNFNTLNQKPLVDPELTPKDIDTPILIENLEEAGAELEKEVESLDDLKDLLQSVDDSIYAELKSDITIATNDNITIPAGKELHLKVDSTITCNKEGFVVEDGGKLVLTGNGVIQTKNKTTSGAIVTLDGPTAFAEIDGPTIDAITLKGKSNNYAYGIYLLNDASIDFKSGIIKTAYGSGISTNGTTGGATTINISGGELYSDGSYAIYLPTQSTINITGGKVQGINARMGQINVSGNAEIIPTTITEVDYDNIGSNFNTSGCVWLGDTIAVMAGTYTDEQGTDCNISILENAKVASNFRSAIGIYEVDTKAAQNVTVNVANAANVTTTAEGFDAISVFNHEYIAEQAQAAGKTYEPTVQSNVVINV